MYDYNLFQIECLTNTQVGSGDETFGDVDNQVQRDPVTDLPIFHASSVKGALREHCMHAQGFNQAVVDWVFGSDDRKPGGEEKPSTSPGNVLFFEARLLLLPLRSNMKDFFWGTSVYVIRDFLEARQQFLGHSDELEELIGKLDDLDQVFQQDSTVEFLVEKDVTKLEIEDMQRKKAVLEKHEKAFKELAELVNVPSEKLTIVRTEGFKEICKSGLPVLARNCIRDDGTSENLWYEEVLPRKTRLWLPLGIPAQFESSAKDYYPEFRKQLTDEGQLVQFGGNKSVGYGVCKVSEVS